MDVINLYQYKSRKPKNFIIINFAFALFYCWFYDFIFSNYIAVLFGSEYARPTSSELIELCIVGALPIVFYKGLSNIASVFSIFVYIFAYVPFNETLVVGGWGRPFLDYRIVFFVAMCAFFISDNIKLYSKPFKSPTKMPFKKFERISWALLILVVGLNVGNLHMTNFLQSKSEMYELRENLHVVGGAPVVYLLYWFKNTILPILLVCYLRNKNVIKVGCAFVGCIVMFMIDQQKITFIAPFVIVALYFFYQMHKTLFSDTYHLLIMGALILFPFLCFLFMYKSDSVYEISAILIMRTQCIEGMELNTYLNFFGHDGLSHPYTYYSHIGIINAITGMYPYSTSLGHAVTNGGANANGMFWLMDGVAAAGLEGCIFISAIFIFVKGLFNGISNRCNVALFSIISLFTMSMTMNVSLFTALLSCGLILFYLIFVYVDFSEFDFMN